MKYTFEFPVFEVLTSLVMTAVVTFLTIRWSIAGARRETMRTIRASLEAEARARRERRAEADEELRRSEVRERSTLVGALMTAVHELEAATKLPRQERNRLDTEARWKALGVVFDTSPLPGAATLYAYADLRIWKATVVVREGKDPVRFVEFLLAQRFAGDVRVAAMAWANGGAIPEAAERELERLVIEREARTRSDREALFNTIVNDE